MKRIPSLDGLRAIAVSLVLLGHLAHRGYLPAYLSTYAGTGVRIFFVISGYLITTILLQEQSRTLSINLREFYIRRAYRICRRLVCSFYALLPHIGMTCGGMTWQQHSFM